MASNKKPESALGIHSAKIIFTRKERDSLEANVHIRYTKKESVKEKFRFPEDIKDERSNIEYHELSWFKPKKLKTDGPICVYHRKSEDDEYFYVNHRNEKIPTWLEQRLEKLVYETYKRNLKNNN